MDGEMNDRERSDWIRGLLSRAKVLFLGRSAGAKGTARRRKKHGHRLGVFETLEARALLASAYWGQVNGAGDLVAASGQFKMVDRIGGRPRPAWAGAWPPTSSRWRPWRDSRRCRAAATPRIHGSERRISSWPIAPGIVLS
jgi:hypothetical protein